VTVGELRIFSNLYSSNLSSKVFRHDTFLAINLALLFKIIPTSLNFTYFADVSWLKRQKSSW